MQFIQQILFAALAITAIYLFTKKAGEIKRNIFLGREEDLKVKVEGLEEVIKELETEEKE